MTDTTYPRHPGSTYTVDPTHSSHGFEAPYGIDKILPAFIAAIAECEDIVKSHTAEVEKRSGGSFRYTYADLATATGALRPTLAKHDLAVIQPVRRNGNTIACHTTIIHTSGQVLSFAPFDMPVPGNDPQSAGSAVTYARRYALLAALGLATEDDDGEAAAKAAERSRAAAAEPAGPQPLSAAAIRYVVQGCEAAGLDPGDVASRATKGRTRDLAEVMTDEMTALRDAKNELLAERAPSPVAAGTGPGEEPPPPPGPEKITSNQQRKLHAAMSGIGVTDRAERLAIVEQIVRRPIESSAFLSKDEAGQVIDTLDRITAGTVALEWVAGQPVIRDLGGEEG